ncbi:5-oxoprolinase subunit B family protein [Antrihabitans cavernicola]|uniref:Allophanate hydrolase subunit 1 n=1 Tax=Antrihabitans cavernicola TaxID=2495913 RepID=A0A5A7S5R7_9NOCA|nr:allophanate hydrolase subunit 1 [Spelaeibacter cavernicola]KAA0021216.1 allophanate hydrolase subunit 1 [Spelaeibacter cavernicola]
MNTIHRAGDRGLLLEPDDRADLDAVVRMLHSTNLAGVADILPAARTVFVSTESSADRLRLQQELRDLCAHLDRSPADSADTELVTIAVRYDGDDLDDVARLLGISVREVIDAHIGSEWCCSFVGFAPGFGYLESAERRLTVPRRTQSRTAVPAGSVALADGYSAVYPRRSPGGWQIIGTADATLWDLDRPHPALLRPGTRVRFTEAASS